MDFKSLFDITKLPSKFFLVIFIVFGLYIFLPSEYLSLLKIKSIEKYDPYIGLGFLFTGGILISNFIIYISKTISIRKRVKENKEDMISCLQNLDSEEKAILREFYRQNKNSIAFPIDDNSVSRLMTNNILVMNSSVSKSGLYFSLSINPSYKKLLKDEYLQ